MKLIYLASPYTNPDPQVEFVRYRLVTEIAAKLTEEYGYAMFLPITQSVALANANPSLKGDFMSWKEIDLYAISKCDEVWVVGMEGWYESVGVRAEIDYAVERNIPIQLVTPTAELLGYVKWDKRYNRFYH